MLGGRVGCIASDQSPAAGRLLRAFEKLSTAGDPCHGPRETNIHGVRWNCAAVRVDCGVVPASLAAQRGGGRASEGRLQRITYIRDSMWQSQSDAQEPEPARRCSGQRSGSGRGHDIDSPGDGGRQRTTAMAPCRRRNHMYSCPERRGVQRDRRVRLWEDRGARAPLAWADGQRAASERLSSRGPAWASARWSNQAARRHHDHG